MPRLSFLLVVLGGCCAGCSQPNALPTEPEPAPPSVPVVDPSPSIEVKPEEKKPTIPETRPVISVGQSLDQALTVLATAKAENISNGVGIFMPVPTDGSPRHECRWFILRDGTCLRVLLRTEGMPEQTVVAGLTLGEEGRGYGGKICWLYEQKHRDVSRWRLP